MKEIRYTLCKEDYEKMNDSIKYNPSLTSEEKTRLSNKLYESNGGTMGDLIREAPWLADNEWRILK